MTSIVIVDDRASNRTILSKLSRAFDSSAEVDCYADPVAALARIRVRPVDLVITDFKMPLLSGADFIRRIYLDNPEFDAPVIVITAYEDRSYRYEALEAGASDFLLSPIDHREFQTRVRNILAAYHRTRSARIEATTLRQELDEEKAQHAETVAASERRLRQVLDTIPSFVFISNASGKVTLANRAFARACGTEPDRLLQRAMADCVPDQSFARMSLAEDARLRFDGGVSSRSESAFTGASGAKIFLQVAKTKLQERPNAAAEILTVATDITQRREAEHALETAIEAANRSSRAKTAFLANMSHELRTPMNAIIGFADMMEREVLGPIGTPRYVEYAYHIRSSADHLLAMINDVLDSAQLEAGVMELIESEFEAEALLEEVRTIALFRAEQANVPMVMRAEPGLRLRADHTKLRQALINLVVNAIHASSSDAEAVTVSAESIETGGLRFTVIDNGMGMTPDELEVALARFGRVLRRENVEPGAGLGLPLSIDLAELHGGSLQVQSQPGSGTRVDLILPAERRVRPAVAATG
jgi:two-component system, cell cycle sensor histidine kinase PleC